MKPRILILKTGTTLPEIKQSKGDFDAMIRAGIAATDADVRVCPIVDNVALPEPRTADGLIITGSPLNVTEDLPWKERTAEWLQKIVQSGIWVLGICFGHQILAYAHGGTVAANPNGAEYGTVPIQLLPNAGRDPLFKAMPQQLWVQASHSQSVMQLPRQAAVLLAANAHTPVQAFRLGERAWGIQFHPEFDAQTTKAYVRHNSTRLQEQGQNSTDLLNACRETPQSHALLQKFVRLVAAGR